jgi:hypothetical protein
MQRFDEDRGHQFQFPYSFHFARVAAGRKKLRGYNSDVVKEAFLDHGIVES